MKYSIVFLLAFIVQFELASATDVITSVRNVSDSTSSTNVELFGGFGTGSSSLVHIGLRGGHTFVNEMYLGFGLGAYGGISGGQAISLFGVSHSLTTRTMNAYTLELGYRLRSNDQFSVLPYLGVGVGVISSGSISQSVGWVGVEQKLSEGTTVTRLLMMPGLRLMYQLKQSSVFVGADSRFLVLNDYSGFSISGLIGLRF